MLPKSSRARTTNDFKPIAILRLTLKKIAYMLLARIEPSLEACQPEERHVFRPHHRLEEHLITAGVVVDNLLSIDVTCRLLALTCQSRLTELIGRHCGLH
jgi:hypothetical protein